MRCVGGVVGDPTGAQSASREGWEIAGKACRGGVDDEVECVRRQPVERHRAHRPLRREAPRKLRGPRRGSVGDHEPSRRLVEQRTDDASRRPSGAQQEHGASTDIDCEIARQVPHQTDPVGVVAAHLRAFEPERVDRARPFRALRAPAGERERLFLERDGHVESAAAFRAEALDRGSKSTRLDEQRVVRDGLAGLGRESPVDEG